MAIKATQTRLVIGNSSDAWDFSGVSNSLDVSLSGEKIENTRFQDTAKTYTTGDASYGTFVIGGAGNENDFNANIGKVIYLDHQSGTSSGSTFPAYTSLIGAGAGALTTMGLWAV